MANNYFQFKQFTVQQEKAALKVSTDSCLFGAWVSHQLQTTNKKPQTILDIGAGSGLLMLMLAQQCSAKVDGIEIDKPSFEQAKENIEVSLWKETMHLFYGDVKDFLFEKKYDFIISNPPFYEGDLKSVHPHKNVAKHDEGLTLDDLVDAVDRNLNNNGSFAVLLPYHRTENFMATAGKKNFYCNKLIKIKQSPLHNYFRSILLLSRNKSEMTGEEIIIKEINGDYSAAFKNLLKDYYLYL